ncbi:MAG: transcriptional regulator [Deltaproteobacteria bacterium]|nr:transcriptional regulator [Deltaproteobacteria bacterium]
MAQLGRWLEAEVITGLPWLDRPVTLVFGSDLMSDVLAFSEAGAVLLTGLTNPQTVRTCEVAGIVGVIFVRGKRPPDAVVALAEEYELPLLATTLSLFDACGKLYAQGVRGFSQAEGEEGW